MIPWQFLLVVALAGFGSAWQIQSWRIDAKEKEYVEQTLREQQKHAAIELQIQSNVSAAQRAATVRANRLRSDADSARTALVGLHDASAAALRTAQDSHAACLERVDTIDQLLRASTNEYRNLAEKADRHVSDVKTMIDSWPALPQ